MSIAALWYKAEMTKNKTKQDKRKKKQTPHLYNHARWDISLSYHCKQIPTI